ncbi:MAG TPA: hypothetical protein VNQ76_19895 [Planctomicrobium sp.]|nr:hypothetical protein [Planctomicrobium sp.]
MLISSGRKVALIVVGFVALASLNCLEAADSKKEWLSLQGESGPGKGKKVVLVSGDEEYRSELVLAQLGKILSKHHGFDATVLFAIDPETGYINPNITTNVPGLEALDSADLMVIFTRFRKLPDDQMKHVDKFLKSGKPVLAIRTATHGFNPPAGNAWAHYANGYKGDKKEWEDGFGRLVLGERWHTHHGHHGHQSTRGMFAPGATDHPVLRGIKDGEIWGASDVYGVRLPLPGDSKPLVLGQVVNRAGEYDRNDPYFGMRPTDSVADPEKNDPMMPIIWLKSYQLPEGKQGESLTSTIGASIDFTNQGVRRAMVNGIYFLLGQTDQIPAEGTNVELVGEFEPVAFGNRKNEDWNERKLTPEKLK